MTEETTRDIAMQAKTLIDQHMQDCVRVRDAMFTSFGEMRTDIKRQNWIIASILGGLIVLERMPDILKVFTTHTP